MIFNSTSFACFLLLVGFLYAVLQKLSRHKLQNWLLLVSSYFFYACWDKRFLYLILFSTVLDYLCGRAIGGELPRWRSVVGAAGVLAIGGSVLCAPIDWGQLYESYLPAQAFTGGWVDPSSNTQNLEQAWWITLIAIVASFSFLPIFWAGRCLGEVQRRGFFLIVSLCGNLGLLAFFKYFDFFVASLQQTLRGIGWSASDWQLGIVVPVGISFYTFQTLSYTIDIYRGDLKPTRSLPNFALFVAYFPQLVAGPIERARVLLPQLEGARVIPWPAMRAGCFLVAWGFFKKIFVADNLAPLVGDVYSSDGNVGGPGILLATYAFAFQIYADFSAYSDIARGVSRCLGIELMVNFNVPFVACSPSEFWRRWHISLSTWLRDYLYIPLGGNRGEGWFVYRNLMITMALGGVWHGARMNFVVWGLYQGAVLCLYRWAESLPATGSLVNRVPPLAKRLLGWLFFFHVMCYGWLIFRCESVAQIAQLTGSLLTGWRQGVYEVGVLARLVWYCGLLVVVQGFQVRTGNLLAPLAWPWPIRTVFSLVVFYLTVVFGAFDEVSFIYFQF